MASAHLQNLTGPIQDQAELSGVLDTLYGLHMAILSIEAINSDQ